MRVGPAHARRQAPGILLTVAVLLRVLVVGVFLLTFIVQPDRIPSASMVPTLQIGDCVLVVKTPIGDRVPREASERRRHGPDLERRFETLLLPPAEVKRGDLVVFHFPPDPARELVKRVVALPGDRVRLRGGRLFLNDRPLAEPYALYTTSNPQIFRDEFPNLREADPNIDPLWWLSLRRTLRADGNLLVPPGMYFVLGDNRNNSEDSRYWGFVPDGTIVGRPLAVYFAVPNGPAPAEDGAVSRLRWWFGWVRTRVGVVH